MYVIDITMLMRTHLWCKNKVFNNVLASICSLAILETRLGNLVVFRPKTLTSNECLRFLQNEISLSCAMEH